MRNTDQNGVMIYLAMLIMSSALATALFVSTVFVKEFRMTKDVADSVRAVYVADSAMERTLYDVRVAKSVNTAFVVSGAGCTASIFASDAHMSCSIDANPAVPLGAKQGCPLLTDPKLKCIPINNDCTSITTKGSYGNVNRALEIVFPNC